MKLDKFVDYLLAAVLMSLAWSLRGQFGHLKGALIPGAAAAVSVALLSTDELWRRALGWALIVSSLGFSLGGHLSYGRVIEHIVASRDFASVAAEVWRFFSTGAVWGGLGLTFLGFGLSEKPPGAADLVLFAVLGLFWFVPLGILNQEPYDLMLFGCGLALIHIYNLAFKKSKIVSLFGLAGIAGFGFGFLAAVILLYAGSHGFLPGRRPWWSLRDQIIGLCGGGFIAWAARRAVRLGLSPVREVVSLGVQKSGFICYVVLIPAVNFLNVLTHWSMGKVTEPAFVSSCCILGFSVLVILLLLISRADAEIFSNRTLDHILYFSTLFFIWFLSLAAMAKGLFPGGFEQWEPAFTFFLFYCLVLTFFLPFRAYRPNSP